MIYAFLIALLLIWVLISIFPKKVFWFGIGTALILSIGDFYFKYTNDRPWDWEGFAVMNLILITVYLTFAILFIIIISYMHNWKKALKFFVLYAIIVMLDFYLLGSYNLIFYSRKSATIEQARSENLLGREYNLRNDFIHVKNHEIHIINVWTENRRIVRYGIAKRKDTTYALDYYIYTPLYNPDKAKIKTLCPINGRYLESYGGGRFNVQDSTETYDLINKSGSLGKRDSIYFRIRINGYEKSFVAYKK